MTPIHLYLENLTLRRLLTEMLDALREERAENRDLVKLVRHASEAIAELRKRIERLEHARDTVL